MFGILWFQQISTIFYKSRISYSSHQEVIPNSPASIAGLRPFSDYIVGSTEIIFQDSEDFFSLVNSNIDKQLHFFVYNKDTDDIRQVPISSSPYSPSFLIFLSSL